MVAPEAPGDRERLSVTPADVERMMTSVFVDGPPAGRQSSRFWVLLLLAAVIATAGVVADSTATVIGAMIVAPLMTPILGVALSVVLADHRHLVRSALLVVGGVLVVIGVGILFAQIGSRPDAFADNSQVNSRISPRLIDLVAALATGLVGAFALVRADISDTLPGVAIAISLVPPLAVVGLLLGVGRIDDAMQAGLLFGTNVAAIIATGVVVLLVYRVRSAAAVGGHEVAALSRRSLFVVGVMVVAIAVPLAIGSLSIARDAQLSARAQPVALAWARSAGWEVVQVEARNDVVVVTAFGPPPEVHPEALRSALNDAGMGSADLIIRLVVGGSRYCPAGTTACDTAPA